MKVASLFAGIGGMPLAARWMGWDPVWVSEIDPYASAVLAKHFPQAVNYGDVQQINGYAVPHADLLTGGFPCQDISLAGKGAGITGARSGLWKQFARLIGEIRPKWVVAENVSALRGRGLDTVLSDLDALGYDAEWHSIPASHIGAPHQRDRIWVVGWPRVDGWAARIGEHFLPARALADADSAGLEGRHIDREHAREWSAWTGRRPLKGIWSTEPAVGRVAHGIPSRVDRLRALGNSIVPEEAYILFKAIEAADRELNAQPALVEAA